MLGRDIFEVNVNIPDVKIRPDLAEYNMMSFNAVAIDSIILRGSRAAAAQDSLLRKVAARTAGVPSVRKSRAYDFHADSLIISEVDVKGVLPREKELLKQRLHIKLGTKLSRSELDHIVARIYGTQHMIMLPMNFLEKRNLSNWFLHVRKVLFISSDWE
jgi:NTE family protein